MLQTNCCHWRTKSCGSSPMHLEPCAGFLLKTPDEENTKGTAVGSLKKAEKGVKEICSGPGLFCCPGVDFCELSDGLMVDDVSVTSSFGQG